MVKFFKLKSILKLSVIMLIISGSAAIYIYDKIKKDPIFKEKIKKTFFPYRVIKEKNDQLSSIFISREEEAKTKQEPIIFQNQISIDFFGKNKSINKLGNVRQITAGIDNHFPGSAYLDVFSDTLYLLSSTGILCYSKSYLSNANNITFEQITTNLDQFLSKDQTMKNRWFSFKDLLVYEDKIFVSYTKEVTKDCWNTSVLKGNLNNKNIVFDEVFSPDTCVLSEGADSLFGDFNAKQSGGRMVGYDSNNIILTTGEFRARDLAQDKNSPLGKILKINFSNKSYKVLSMGHRNPQGLLYNKDKGFFLSSEHGPQGGDEINLLKHDSDMIINFGWPIASYGDHYHGPSNWVEEAKKNPFPKEVQENKYRLYPLHKSHADHGFEEPIKYFSESPGLSEIIHIDSNRYMLSSLKFRSIYTFELDDDNKVQNLTKSFIGERIRDLSIDRLNGKILLFLEDTASIGIMKFQ